MTTIIGKAKYHLKQSYVTIWSCGQGITWQVKKSCISTSTRPMTTELDKEVASDEKMLSFKLHNLLIT